MFTALVAYKQMHGDCKVPARWPENPQLSTWVHEQRKRWRRGKLSQERIRKLEQVGFVCGKSNPKQRTPSEAMLAELADYKQKYGDFNVAQKWPENPELATWIGNQRRLKNEGKLSEGRIRSLEYLDFIWDIGQAAWERMFAELVVYRKKFGNCEVPAEWDQNRKLGRWVQHSTKTEERRKTQPTTYKETLQPRLHLGQARCCLGTKVLGVGRFQETLSPLQSSCRLASKS